MIFTLAALAVSAAVQGYSMYKQSKESEATAKYNAAVSEIQAENKAKALSANADIMADNNREKFASIQARMLTSGVESGGSPLVVMSNEISEDQADFAELHRQARNTITQGDTNAALLRREGELAKDNRNLSLLGLAAGTAGKGMTAYSRMS